MSQSEKISTMRAWLSAPISGQSLAVLRIFFGLLLLYDYVVYIIGKRIFRYYVLNEIHFPYFGLDFIKPLPEPWIYIAWGLVGVSAALVALGLFYRAAIITFLITFGYFFLLDRVQYLNHNYMILLYAFLLALSPANKVWSLDARFGRTTGGTMIPRWPVFALKLQTEIILIFAGLVKITDDWLRGQPLMDWLPPRVDKVFYGPLFQYDIVAILASYGVIALHVLGAPLLMFRKTRLPVFIIYCFFHVSNAHLFNIGIFPWLTIGVTLIFFDPDWPSQVWRRFRSVFGAKSAAPADHAPPADPASDGTTSVRPIRTGMLAVLIVWFAIQLFLPVRQAMFPNLVGWTGDGHRFSWRMRVYSRRVEGGYLLVNSETGEQSWVYPLEVLPQRRAKYIMTRADISRDFAFFLAERMKICCGWNTTEVYPRYEVSLNGRPPQPFLDPNVDLTKTKRNLFKPDPWIMPLETRAAEGKLPDWFPPLPLQKPPY